jgi:imidazolonepropionase-like amidohydrolase
LCRIIPLFALAAAGWAQAPVTIRAGTLLDGRGAIRKNVKITVEGSKILRIESGGAGPVPYGLSSRRVMPGWIDTHVHLNGYFNKDGKADTRGVSPPESTLKIEGNACRSVG